ncbi:hypothetical protein FHW69_001718 [Luteibacter sp. Sphag1AF]|uniref:XVIPCD domain-containing protein n=1 Tax=Luteibacter sp. Sphag1AF TaxID=2587031 RepID=UPI00161C42E2|nr:XVIPCD domain-containing protein [Luteibacter sp. Sphag1AF]MBB3227117.1 hypothetical protein [Luteibacter sp. Sphag1AF]
MTVSTTDYALLAQNSYQTPVVDKLVKLNGVEYTTLAAADNPHTGFQATAYRREDTGEVVIAYRGTEFDREPVHDGGVDAGMVLTGFNAQAPDAIAFTEKVMEKAKFLAETRGQPLDVTVTGHSLGGTLAEINASRFHLKGETFNAYGAAGLLHGVPEGGNQVIDHVRAGDLVSAASPHFGEVRVYAAQQDIDTLSKAGYRDDSGPLSLRNPLKATDFSAHAMDNFVPNSETLGKSIISPEGQALYEEHKGMVDRYRDDVRDIRTTISAPWEIPKAIVHTVQEVGHNVAEKVEEGFHAVEKAASHAVHEVGETLSHVGHEISEKASSAWNTITHPGSWFDDKPKVAEATRLDQPNHPDHALFQQARGGVHELDAAHQRTPDQRSDNLAASLTVAARRDGLTRIDHVTLSDDASRTYAVQGDMQSPLKRVADVSTQEAVATSVDKSSANWNQVAEQNQQAHAQLARQNEQQASVQRSSPMPGQ